MKIERIERWAPAIFWALLLGINLMRAMPFLEADQITGHLATLAIIFPLDIVSFSVFYFWLIPQLMRKRKVLLHSALVLLLFLTYGFVYDLVYYLAGRISNFDGFLAIYKSSCGHTILALLYAVVLRFSVDWFRKFKRQRELESENTVIELALLRSQIEPHFLFNVLNNIHSFVHDDSDKTSYSLIKLSELMRYMLHEGSKPKVLLSQEIGYIESYLSLQKLRLQDGNNVRFEVNGETKNIEISPLIFIAFVENAFKHGKKNIKDGIVISIDVEPHALSFACSNYKRSLSATETQTGYHIGLENVKRRLELLYPDEHELSIESTDDKFEVKLNLKLS